VKEGIDMCRRRILPIYAKSRDAIVGVEVAEAYKTNKDPAANDPLRAEGRVSLRFFNCSMPKDTQILTMLEPWEAFDLYLKMHKVARAEKSMELKLAPHKFVKAGEEIMTTVSVEKWVRDTKSGYALKVVRKGQSHSVSMDEAHFLHTAEFLKFLSTIQSYQDVELEVKRVKR
jgi:hypothetical protein